MGIPASILKEEEGVVTWEESKEVGNFVCIPLVELLNKFRLLNKFKKDPTYEDLTLFVTKNTQGGVDYVTMRNLELELEFEALAPNATFWVPQRVDLGQPRHAVVIRKDGEHRLVTSQKIKHLEPGLFEENEYMVFLRRKGDQ